MNNLPGTFSLRNHFSSSPLFRPRSRSQAPPEVRYLFPKEPLFLMPPGRARSPRGNQGNRVRKAGPPHYFRGNHSSSFLPAEIGLPSTASRSARRESLHMFLREPLSLIPLGFTDAPLAPDSLQQFFSSPSLQGGSGIPAVPKTGASVLRLLPPTS